MGVLDLGGRPRAARWRRVRSSVDSPDVQPGPQVALLGAREPGDRGGVAGVLLDQREGLQHRVVQVGGDVGALLGADPLRALVGQVGREPEDPRPDDDAEPTTATRAATVTSQREPNGAAAQREQQQGQDDQRDAGGRAGRTTPSRRRRGRPATGLTRPVVSSQRSRCASSACRQSRAMPASPIAIGQNSAPRPNSASICRRGRCPAPRARRSGRCRSAGGSGRAGDRRAWRSRGRARRSRTASSAGSSSQSPA